MKFLISWRNLRWDISNRLHSLQATSSIFNSRTFASNVRKCSFTWSLIFCTLFRVSLTSLPSGNKLSSLFACTRCRVEMVCCWVSMAASIPRENWLLSAHILKIDNAVHAAPLMERSRTNSAPAPIAATAPMKRLVHWTEASSVLCFCGKKDVVISEKPFWSLTDALISSFTILTLPLAAGPIDQRFRLFSPVRNRSWANR